MRVSLVSCQWLLTSALTRTSSFRIARLWSNQLLFNGFSSLVKWLLIISQTISMDWCGLPFTFNEKKSNIWKFTLFKVFLKAAAEEGSEAHRKLYWFQVKCFQVCNHQRQRLIQFISYFSGRWHGSRRDGVRGRVWQDDGRCDSCSDQARTSSSISYKRRKNWMFQGQLFVIIITLWFLQFL